MDLFEKMKDPNWVECPNCNGYGSSLRESSPKCSQCFGDGLIRKKMETMVYNPYTTRKPFCIIQENGERTVYDRDEIKELGQKYDNAASKAIIAGSSILIEV